jgi:hypothetical protein
MMIIYENTLTGFSIIDLSVITLGILYVVKHISGLTNCSAADVRDETL